MASLYRKRNSPHWFVQFIDGDGKRRNNLRGIENRDWLNVLKRSAQICAVAGDQTVED
jgi:hypothetical protein